MMTKLLFGRQNNKKIDCNRFSSVSDEMTLICQLL